MAKYGIIISAFICLWVYCHLHIQLVEGKSTMLQKGEKCGNGTLARDMCDFSRFLECSNGVCDCKSGFTISRNGTKCLEVARYGLESSCEESIQCWKSLLGRLAECNIGTNKCSCYESETLPIVFHKGRCNYGEALGEYCQIEGLCSATTANAVCRSGTCQCKVGFVPSWDKSRCLPIATHGLNSSCEENIQCEKSSLGTLSECNPDRMQCECYEIPQVPTVFHGGRCYFGAGLGDTCQVNSQCTSKTEHSICGKDGKCSCEYPFVSNVNQSECIHVPIHVAAADGTGSTTVGMAEFRSEPFQCIENNHCSSKFGYFSRCNKARGKCECFNPDNNLVIKELKGSTLNSNPNPNLVSSSMTAGNINIQSSNFDSNSTKPLIDSVNASSFSSSSLLLPSSSTSSSPEEGMKCYTTKYLGQSCKFHTQCSTVTENSLCVNGLCECREATHVPSEDRRKCLEIAYGYQFPCDEDAQCTKSPLGSLSMCNSVNNKCECSRDFPVVYHEPKCYLLRQLGATCESHWECRSHINSLAECHHGRCQCGRNSTPDDDNSCILQIPPEASVSSPISASNTNANSHATLNSSTLPSISSSGVIRSASASASASSSTASARDSNKRVALHFVYLVNLLTFILIRLTCT